MWWRSEGLSAPPVVGETTSAPGVEDEARDGVGNGVVSKDLVELSELGPELTHRRLEVAE